MAKKQVNENLTQHGSSKRCTKKGCMGTPKKVKDATTFTGTLCADPECGCVYMYDKSEFQKINSKIEVKIKDKTMMVDEKELEKFIEKADKLPIKKVKKKDGEQIGLNL